MQRRLEQFVAGQNGHLEETVEFLSWQAALTFR